MKRISAPWNIFFSLFTHLFTTKEQMFEGRKVLGNFGNVFLNIVGP